MLNKDPYAVMRALLRAEAARNTPKPEPKSDEQQRQRSQKERERG
ncbi:hypothetical protein GCM10027074_47560 [Streptomyces deserti]